MRKHSASSRRIRSRRWTDLGGDSGPEPAQDFLPVLARARRRTRIRVDALFAEESGAKDMHVLARPAGPARSAAAAVAALPAPAARLPRRFRAPCRRECRQRSAALPIPRHRARATPPRVRPVRPVRSPAAFPDPRNADRAAIPHGPAASPGRRTGAAARRPARCGGRRARRTVPTSAGRCSRYCRCAPARVPVTSHGTTAEAMKARLASNIATSM